MHPAVSYGHHLVANSSEMERNLATEARGGPTPRATAIVLVATLVAATLAYAPALHGEFVFDDEQHVLHDMEVKDVGRLLHALRPASFLEGSRRLAQLTFAANYATGRVDPFGYHVTNLLIHLAATLLAWALARYTAQAARHARAGQLALVTAAAFALHPLQTQAVSYVVQRSESLGALLYMAALYLLLVAEDRGTSWRGAALYVAGFVALWLGFGAKPLVITAPFAFLLHRWYLGEAPRDRARLARHLAVVAPWIAVTAVTVYAQLRGLAGEPTAGFDASLESSGAMSSAPIGAARYFATELCVLPRYVRLLLLPVGQSIDHVVAPAQGLLDLHVALCGAAVLALALGPAIVAWRRPGPTSRLVAFGSLWFFLVLSPTSTFMPIQDFMVEHRTYLANWGGLLALLALLDAAVSAATRRPLARVAPYAVLCAGLGACTVSRNQVWESGEALWSDAATKAPDNGRAHGNLAYAYQRRGNWPAAVAEYERALQLVDPQSRNAVIFTRNLGALYLDTGDYPRSAAISERGLALNPGEPELENNLAAAYVELGKTDQAERLILRALALLPNRAVYHLTLGRVFLARGSPSAALSEYERAEALDPDNAIAALNGGTAAQLSGDVALSCAKYGRALRLGVPRSQGLAVMQAMQRLRCSTAP